MVCDYFARDQYTTPDRSRMFSVFVIVLSVLYSGVLDSDLCNVKVAMHGVLNMVKNLADPFIWPCGVDGMGHCSEMPTWWSKSGILQEKAWSPR